MTPADRLDMLAAFGVRVSLSEDGNRLDVEGPALVIEAATLMLRANRPALVAHLRRCAAVLGKAA